MSAKRKFNRSEELLRRAEKIIPLGTQTFSKSKTQYPVGISPLYAVRAEGSSIWDVDGNEFIDFVNSLCAILLGYKDSDVTDAVKAQLERGIIYTLPDATEVTVSEKIIEMIPSAEMVRFGKNGSDATAGAIRLARAYTGRDHCLVCGYHGWQDWYIGSTSMSRGVPKAVRDLTHQFKYNDLDSLHTLFKKYKGDVAAVIMEPENIEEPKDGFLEGVREIASKRNAVLIFDEMITGFRYARGGAQEYYGVTPDLTAIGKGMANGYPLSAVVGKEEIMRLMEEIYFSFTFGGEILSLAACNATLDKIDKEPVLSHIWEKGQKIIDGLNILITKNKLDNMLSIAGKPCWSTLVFQNTEKYSQWEIKTLWMQEMIARGILSLGSHNISYAHSDDDIRKLLDAYSEVLPILYDSNKKGDLEKRLKCKPLENLFRIR